MSDIVKEIMEWKQKRGAVILAHNYVRGEIQDIADFTGDSLELSIRARESGAGVLLFCGVRFMAETAKLLSPDSVVLLPNPEAGCPMADMASAAAVAEYRKEHPQTLLAAYVNSTAEVKASVDICCTSGNAETILSSLPSDRDILFLPDRNLGRNMSRKLKRPMQFWEGCCPIHDAVTPEMIRSAREKFPGALVLIHPECRPEAVAEADHALSTGGMLRFVRESTETRFIIGTESGILHRLKKENPGKEFYPLQPEMICADMKKITLEQVRDALRDMKTEVQLDPALMSSALAPILKMLS